MKINATLPGGDCPRTFALNGRLGWTVFQLAKAGNRGVTPLEVPAPRWSGYVHDLRKLGIPIETRMEPHEGMYAGHHARYTLAPDVVVTLPGQGGQE